MSLSELSSALQQKEEDEQHDALGLDEESAREYIEKVVNDWIDIEEQMKSVRADLKELNKLKKELDTKIIKFMSDNHLPEFPAEEGKILYEEKERPTSLNKDLITDTLKDELDAQKAEAISETLFKKRPTVTKAQLKLIKKPYGGKKRK